MSTLYLVSFLVGLGLSVIAFVSGLEHISLFDHAFGDGHADGLSIDDGSTGDASPLNMAAITAFLVWFGGAGVVMQQLTGWPALAVAGGAAGAGLMGGSMVNRFLRLLRRGERPLEQKSFVGTIARVISPIREGGTGEIVFSLDGTRHSMAARSEAGKAIHRECEVVIIRYEKGIAYVSTWDEFSEQSNHS